MTTAKSSPKRLTPMRAIVKNQNASSLVEFALITPVFLFLLGAVVDCGTLLYNRFLLSNSVTAATVYALDNASMVNSTSGATLAANLSAILASTRSANWANVSVTINNGPAKTITNGVAQTNGTAANANNYYCPTGTAQSLTWGSTYSSGASCASGAYAGKFVLITASKSYTPMILSTTVIPSAITSTALVQVQ